MAIIQGVSEKVFTNGKEFHPLLSELIDCASFPRQLQINQKTKGLVEKEGLEISEVDFVAWFKCVCLKSQKIILSRPNGKTKTEYRLKNCISSLSPTQRTFLARVIDTNDATNGNRVFLERVKTLLEKSLKV
jgi:hypothetical protein